jgi:hypothetical protein
MVWKTFFHSMEKTCDTFPWYGKPGVKFSMVWKTVFHGVEKRTASGRARGAATEIGI